MPHDSAEVETICAQMATEIRSQHTIAYAPSDPPKPGAYHTIQLVAKALHRGKLTVRTRTGYRAPI